MPNISGGKEEERQTMLITCDYRLQSLYRVCSPNLKSVAVALPERWTKLQNLKVGQCDLDYIPI